MYQSLTLGAGSALEFQEQADFVRLLTSSMSDISLIFYRRGQEVGRAENVGAGYAETFAQPFDKMRMQSAGGGDVEFVMREGSKVNYDVQATGQVVVTNTPSVNVANNQGAFTHTAATVTNASGQLLAANAARRFLMIQNKDGTGAIFVNLGGAAATAANGIKVGPGGSLLLDVFAPSGAIYAIGDIANNPNVLVVEA